MLRPVAVSHGVVTLIRGRGKPALWSNAAVTQWGEKDPSDGLHNAARKMYPVPRMSDFERMHNLDPVRQKLLEEMAAQRGEA